MALTCARCGAQNIEGNRFCQVCGTPLAAVAAVASAPGFAGPPSAPQAAYASPPGFAAPPGYQTPYYAPSAAGPQAPVHRIPWMLIISAVVVLLVVMAGGGTAFALLHNQPGTGGTGIAPQVPSPSPAVSPSPIASPSTLAGPTASNAGETFPLPTGWVVDSKDSESITISNPSGTGSVTVGSGPSNPSQSAQQNKDTVDKFFTGKYPDTKNCANSKTTTGSLSGASGIFWELCFTLVSGNQSVPAAAPIFAGANADGAVYYVVMLLTSSDKLQAFIKETAPILAGIQWKLK